jgi:hypothetical protein
MLRCIVDFGRCIWGVLCYLGVLLLFCFWVRYVHNEKIEKDWSEVLLLIFTRQVSSKRFSEKRLLGYKSKPFE